MIVISAGIKRERLRLYGHGAYLIPAGLNVQTGFGIKNLPDPVALAIAYIATTLGDHNTF